MEKNRLIDLYEKYYYSTLDELDRQNFLDAEAVWQRFLKVKGYKNKKISRDDFGNLCFEFMLSLRSGK
ncbi:hypothetical protein ACXJQ9_10350 (plasmid) [Lactobacillus johnsonii]